MSASPSVAHDWNGGIGMSRVRFRSFYRRHRDGWVCYVFELWVFVVQVIQSYLSNLNH